MDLLLKLLAYRPRTAPVQWRINLAARTVLAKVIKEPPVGEFSAQLNALRESINEKGEHMDTPKAGWTPEQERVIALYVEKFGMTRSNAIRRMRGQALRGITPANILASAAAPKLQMKQVQEQRKATPKPGVVAMKAEKKAAKPKAPRKHKFNVNLDPERVKRLFKEHKTVAATALALGFPKNAGQNRTRRSSSWGW